jgi:hypothetical protein
VISPEVYRSLTEVVVSLEVDPSADNRVLGLRVEPGPFPDVGKQLDNALAASADVLLWHARTVVGRHIMCVCVSWLK